MVITDPVISAVKSKTQLYQNCWAYLQIYKKQEIVIYHWNIAMFQYGNAKMQFVQKVKKGQHNLVKNLLIAIESMFYNAFVFLPLYNDLNGLWDNFGDELIDMIELLEQVKKTEYRNLLLEQVEANPEWYEQYLKTKIMKLNVQ